MTTKLAARRLGITPSEVTRLCRTGKLRALKVVRRDRLQWEIPRAEVRRLIRERRHG